MNTRLLRTVSTGILGASFFVLGALNPFPRAHVVARLLLVAGGVALLVSSGYPTIRQESVRSGPDGLVWMIALGAVLAAVGVVLIAVV